MKKQVGETEVEQIARNNNGNVDRWPQNPIQAPKGFSEKNYVIPAMEARQQHLNEHICREKGPKYE